MLLSGPQSKIIWIGGSACGTGVEGYVIVVTRLELHYLIQENQCIRKSVLARD